MFLEVLVVVFLDVVVEKHSHRCAVTVTILVCVDTPDEGAEERAGN